MSKKPKPEPTTDAPAKEELTCMVKEEDEDEGPSVDPLSLVSFSAERGFDPASRTIFLTGVIDLDMYSKFQVAMTFLQMSPDPIFIQLCSPGGSVYAALGIVALITSVPNMVIIEAMGEVASAATLILASGDVRMASEFTWLMTHCSQYGAQGRHAEMRASVAQGEAEEKMWAKWMEKFTMKPAKFWLETGLNVDYYFTPSEGKKIGIIDKIIPIKPRKKKVKSSSK